MVRHIVCGPITGQSPEQHHDGGKVNEMQIRDKYAPAANTVGAPLGSTYPSIRATAILGAKAPSLPSSLWYTPTSSSRKAPWSNQVFHV